MFNENDNTSKSEDKKISEETENLIKEPEQALKNNENENFFKLKKSTKELSEISKEESLKRLFLDYEVKKVDITEQTHPKYLIDNLDKYKNYILDKEIDLK